MSAKLRRLRKSLPSPTSYLALSFVWLAVLLLAGMQIIWHHNSDRQDWGQLVFAALCAVLAYVNYYQHRRAKKKLAQDAAKEQSLGGV